MTTAEYDPVVSTRVSPSLRALIVTAATLENMPYSHWIRRELAKAVAHLKDSPHAAMSTKGPATSQGGDG